MRTEPTSERSERSGARGVMTEEKFFLKLENFKNSPYNSSYIYILIPEEMVKKMKITKKFLIKRQQECD